MGERISHAEEQGSAFVLAERLAYRHSIERIIKYHAANGKGSGAGNEAEHAKELSSEHFENHAVGAVGLITRINMCSEQPEQRFLSADAPSTRWTELISRK